MEYRRMGDSGLKLSVLSLGSWVTYGQQVDVERAAASIRTAYDAGVNFFDNAESYAGGEAERIMGEALRRLGLRRGSYVLSTKFYWGLHEGPLEKNTLNRKRLREAIDGSLQRLGFDYVDLVFCHRPDPDTPIEETVWSMHMMIERGQALYWGTSEWSADQLLEAWAIAERHHLHKPRMEQPQYNLFVRRRVEQEYRRLYERIGLGLTTWSPLASGLLTGKYDAGIPRDSRLALPGYEWLRDSPATPGRIKAARRLEPIARELGCSRGQLALAWCARNPRVSTVITGASRPEQVAQNLAALEVLPRLTDETVAEIERAVGEASDLPPRS